MKKYTLRDYLDRPGKTQTGLAKDVGLTQGAINQMLKKKRNIFVIEHSDGSLKLEEVRLIESKKPEPQLGAA